MSLLYEDIKKDSTGILTSEKAMEIYGLLKVKTPSEVFTTSDSLIDWQHIELVIEEANQIEGLVNQYMSGSILLEAEESHYDEEGEKVIDSEAVYYKPTTKANLVEQIETEYLDVDSVVTDMQDGKTWLQFVASYN